MKKLKIAFVGAGKMNQAVMRGLISDLNPGQVCVSNPSGSGLKAWQEDFGCLVTRDNKRAIIGADAIVWGVKPWQIEAVATDTKQAIENKELLLQQGKKNSELAAWLQSPASQYKTPIAISLAAGVACTNIQKWLGPTIPLIRAMPNTPAQIGEGVTTLFAAPGVAKEQRNLAETIMGAVGRTFWLEDESLMHIATAVAGSGPAYVFFLMEMMKKTAIAKGLPRDMAHQLVTQTVLGASHLAKDDGGSFEVLRAAVTSKGGTTAAAVATLFNGGVDSAITEAIEAAARRSEEMAVEYSESTGGGNANTSNNFSN